jgi:hypothetical protein
MQERRKQNTRLGVPFIIFVGGIVEALDVKWCAGTYPFVLVGTHNSSSVGVNAFENRLHAKSIRNPVVSFAEYLNPTA